GGWLRFSGLSVWSAAVAATEPGDSAARRTNMTTKQCNSGVRPWQLYSSMASVFMSMWLVLFASKEAEGHWFRLFVMVYLTAMQLLFVVMSIGARRAEKQSEGQAANQGAAAAPAHHSGASEFAAPPGGAGS